MFSRLEKKNTLEVNRIARIKMSNSHKCWRRRGENGILTHCCGNGKRRSCFGEQSCSCETIKRRVTTWPSHLPKRSESMCPHKHLQVTVYNSIIPGREEGETSQVSINSWMEQKVVYYWAIKRNEILTHVTTWVNLENIKLVERG